jgi:hypothetical protein
MKSGVRTGMTHIFFPPRLELMAMESPTYRLQADFGQASFATFPQQKFHSPTSVALGWWSASQNGDQLFLLCVKRTWPSSGSRGFIDRDFEPLIDILPPGSAYCRRGGIQRPHDFSSGASFVAHQENSSPHPFPGSKSTTLQLFLKLSLLILRESNLGPLHCHHRSQQTPGCNRQVRRKAFFPDPNPTGPGPGPLSRSRSPHESH